jgi:hypothetical protein
LVDAETTVSLIASVSDIVATGIKACVELGRDIAAVVGACVGLGRDVAAGFGVLRRDIGADDSVSFKGGADFTQLAGVGVDLGVLVTVVIGLSIAVGINLDFRLTVGIGDSGTNIA